MAVLTVFFSQLSNINFSETIYWKKKCCKSFFFFLSLIPMPMMLLCLRPFKDSVSGCVESEQDSVNTDGLASGQSETEWGLKHLCRINKHREWIALHTREMQQQRPESPAETPPGMQVSPGYINSTKGTSSNLRMYLSWCLCLFSQRFVDFAFNSLCSL